VNDILPALIRPSARGRPVKAVTSKQQSVYVINLERRTDRRREMESELARVGWDATFFPAIEPTSSAGFASVGARGCFLSHLSVLKTARDAAVERLVILEDDVNFVRNFGEKWRWMETELAVVDWSVCYPGHAMGTLPQGISALSPQTSVLCAHFMVINRRAINLIVEGLETILSRSAGHPLGGPMHVDGAYSTIRAQNPALNTYALFPTLGYQRPSRTDIRRGRWFDRLSVLQPAVKVMRRIKGVGRRN
jgi:glycosyl transferase, family 25